MIDASKVECRNCPEFPGGKCARCAYFERHRGFQRRFLRVLGTMSEEDWIKVLKFMEETQGIKPPTTSTKPRTFNKPPKAKRVTKL